MAEDPHLVPVMGVGVKSASRKSWSFKPKYFFEGSNPSTPDDEYHLPHEDSLSMLRCIPTGHLELL
jgi:hypothetical protein